MSTATDHLAAPSGEAGAAAGAQNAVRPVLWVAGLGAGFLLLALCIMGAWVVSPQFAPTARGPDPMPAATLYLVRGFEAASLLTAAAVVVWLIRGCLRQRRLSLEAIVTIAWVCCYWQDPLINWARPVFFYNSYFVNMGSWALQVPGWVSPGGERLPDPLLFMAPMYVYLPTLVMLAVDASLRAIRARFPQMSVMQVILAGVGVCILLDVALELVWVRSGLYGYPGVIRAFSVYAGTTHQFPLYESLLWGPVWASTGLLYHFRTAEGRTVLDAGLDEVRSARLRSPLRVLAMIGFLNVPFLTYSVIMVLISFHVDATPEGFPSWLRNGMCGPGSAYACPGPGVPVPTPAG